MGEPNRHSLHFGWLTAVVWLLAAGGSIFLLWQLINRISAANLPISTATPNLSQMHKTIAALLTPQQTRSVSMVTPTIVPPTSAIPIPVTSLPLTSQGKTSTPPTGSQTTTPTKPCDRAAAGKPIDITIPDDSLISSGQSFVKTWKLVNSGSCTWTAAYAVAFFYGDRMQAPESVPLNETVLPEQSVEISIDMVAPAESGTYQGNWKLSNPGGTLFGIGPNGDSPFWVRIIVPELSSNTSTPTESITATPVITTTPGTPATASPTSATTPAPTTLPPLQATGELALIPGDSIDLDDLKITNDDQDLKYQADANNYHWLTPVDETRIGVYGSLDPDYPNCQSASMSQAPIAVESLSIGTYLCYTTDDERFGKALFVALNTSNYTLTLDLYTWAKP